MNSDRSNENEISVESKKKNPKGVEREQVTKQVEDLSRGCAEIISVEDLTRKLNKSKKTGKILKIKLGIDPTAPNVHLGFAVVLRKMRKFQDLGHRAQLIIGDFTARVGDPSDRSETRKMLTPSEIEENAATYREQLSLILDPDRTDVYFNSRWLEPMNFASILSLTSKYTVARILERDDFSNRLKSGKPLGMHEILYPLMQGYDSVVLQSDVEMGGTDQKFNILIGRDLQREFGQEPQVVFLMPILEGTDGVLKMSKSYGNYIGITEPPTEIFGKVMSIPDKLIYRYFELCTDVPIDEVRQMQEKMETGDANPKDIKTRLAAEIITIYYDRDKAKDAEEEFLKVFSRGELPSDIPELKVPVEKLTDGKILLPVLLEMANIAPSKREAKRLIKQGAVKVDGVKIVNEKAEINLENEVIIQVGNRKFVRICSGS